MTFAKLLTVAVAPVLILLIYLYIRDKYEKEPLRLLTLGVVYGVVISFPIIQLETMLTALIPITGVIGDALYTSFAVASLAEEAMKFTVLFFLVWRNRNLNERFDGIVYAAFISLGFAGYENILYVLNPDFGGMSTALSRAFISVPGHGFFGVAMGYHFALAKFEPEKRYSHLFMAFAVPYFIHGVYDFLLLSNLPYVMLAFAAFLVWMWIYGFRRMKSHIERSPFKKSA